MKIYKSISLVPILLVLPWNISLHFSNKTEEMRIGEASGYAEIHVLVRECKVHPKNGRDYHWLKGSSLMVSESGSAGRLLHGGYISFYDNGQLHEKGKMYRGLKVGEWRKWNDQGELVQIENWKQGVLHGSQEKFNTLSNHPKTVLYKNGEVVVQEEKEKSAKKLLQEKKRQERAEKKKLEKLEMQGNEKE